MSVSVADQGNFYKDSPLFCGYSSARRVLAEEKSSRRLVGVILPNQHSLSFSLYLFLSFYLTIHAVFSRLSFSFSFSFYLFLRISSAFPVPVPCRFPYSSSSLILSATKYGLVELMID